ncbi:MAG TPA: mannose-1-phosphate guanylyltransferase [Planctomycetes bacterium]|nr:mannose-1-phosphate guanylyltransferase [Planctomycetota bacterium]
MLHAVIMAGGSGVRFWPASRKTRPKQVLSVAGGSPLILQTLERLEGLVPPERITILTSRPQLEVIRRTVPEEIRPRVLAEPVPRDTAPCAALAALLVEKAEPGAVMALLPADHLIAPAAAFREALAAAAAAARDRKALVTFGIPPTFPATGYGYIQRGDRAFGEKGLDFYRVRTFREKPGAETAARWLEEGGWFWNSGIFVWKAAVLLEEIRRHAPDLAEVVEALERAWGTPAWEEALEEHFPRAPRGPIDKVVMEKTDRGLVLPASFAWDDLGSWRSLPSHHPAGERGNTAVFPAGGRHVDLDSRDLVVFSQDEHLVATLGLEGLTIVHTPDATLVCPTERAQEIRDLVKLLREKGMEKYT